MIHFFGNANSKIFAVQTSKELLLEDIQKLNWLFGNQEQITQASIDAFFIGPRAAMITPWSTNAVEITQNMGVSGILRIEEFVRSNEKEDFDPMILQKYTCLNQDIFTIDTVPEAILEVEDINAYNETHAVDKSLLINGRNLTNIGVFRKYIETFIEQHSAINKEMMIMVRQLQPSAQGLPIEIYAFSSDKRWANYEFIIADIFDHMIASVNDFDLEISETPVFTSLKK